MIIKIILILVVWAIFWGGCMGEFFYLEEAFEFTDICVIVSFFFAPFVFVGMGVFILIYKNMKNKKELAEK